MLRTIEKVAPTDISVLLLGESGTGKELLARAIHALSPRAKGPFVALSCAAIPDTLFESELFGHEKGAFTGAVKQTLGKIESANKGTLFLDEIGDVPQPMQVKMLRFLQNQVIERVGGRRPIQVDVRVVCATHQNLTQLIAEGRFREDLFYRINEVCVQVPALRERVGDAALLASYFLRRFAAEFKRPVRELRPGRACRDRGSSVARQRAGNSKTGSNGPSSWPRAPQSEPRISSLRMRPSRSPRSICAKPGCGPSEWSCSRRCSTRNRTCRRPPSFSGSAVRRFTT